MNKYTENPSSLDNISERTQIKCINFAFGKCDGDMLRTAKLLNSLTSIAHP